MSSEEFDLSKLYSMMRPKNICICRAVNENTLINAVEDGCDTFEKLQSRTNAATKCGACSLMVRTILERELLKKQNA